MHPIHSKNADFGCRWLALNAGQLTKKDELELTKALNNLPFQGKAFVLPEVDMLMRVK